MYKQGEGLDCLAVVVLVESGKGDYKLEEA